MESLRGCPGQCPGRRLPVPARVRRDAAAMVGRRGGGSAMKVALYARVSTQRQAERGTIGSQLQVLRDRVTASGDELGGGGGTSPRAGGAPPRGRGGGATRGAQLRVLRARVTASGDELVGEYVDDG